MLHMNTRMHHKLALAIMGLLLLIPAACGSKGPPPPPKIGEGIWGQNLWLKVQKVETSPFLVYSRDKGSVSVVNAAQNTVTILPNRQPPAVTLTVSADSKIVRNDAEATLADVAADDVVEEMQSTEGTVTRLVLHSGAKYWKIAPPEGQQFTMVWVDIYQNQAGTMQLNPVSDRVEVRDNKDTKYTPIPITGGEAIQSSPSGYYIPLFTEPVSLPPGNQISGWLAFVTPKGTSLKEFVWDEIDRLTIRLS